ncbi:polysaccharide pyruvyl transferase family protein [Nitrosomonas ureae]|uniref:Pyruvyltransferase n=1 Tax=Nitrosomonas ureae TaxID=44577 RepID=A0A1H9D0A1_9PROT|nr:polysaccharide pyruvyl transferase family protein [Nitrosomonas ureae]SEQ06821.1 pyruvyltransferase [Nitrosomonas ureae]
MNTNANALGAISKQQVSRSIKLKYFQEKPNVGDHFSLVLASHYFSSNIIVSSDDQPLTQENLLLVGSIVEWADAMSYICGSGLMFSESKLKTQPKSINCVRGPLTEFFMRRQGIKFTKPVLFGDPAVLAPKIFPRNQAPCTQIGIIPHYVDEEVPWIMDCHKKGLSVIDILSPLDEFFDKIQQCEIVLSSSLHGIIFAHAYMKPALWIELSDHVGGNGFKFFDYYLSIGVSPEKVTRIRVRDNIDPYEIAKFATEGNHTDLISSVETAIYQTNCQLNEAIP